MDDGTDDGTGDGTEGWMERFISSRRPLLYVMTFFLFVEYGAPDSPGSEIIFHPLVGR